MTWHTIQEAALPSPLDAITTLPSGGSIGAALQAHWLQHQDLRTNCWVGATWPAERQNA